MKTFIILITTFVIQNVEVDNFYAWNVNTGMTYVVFICFFFPNPEINSGLKIKRERNTVNSGRKCLKL